jgi:hypothetical protein
MAANDLTTEAQIDALVAAIVADANGLRTSIGTLTSLSTTAKANLVAAINEVKSVADAAAGGGVSINDAATNTTQTWSSSKINGDITSAVSALVNAAPGTLDTLDELAAALGDDANFASTVTTALAARLRVDTAAQGLTGTQQSNALTNLGLAFSSADFAADYNAAVA